MGQRQVEAHRHGEAGGHEPLSGPRDALAQVFVPWLEHPRLVDSPAFPTFDVACPMHRDELARAALERAAACPLVQAVEVGAGAFVHLRWRDEVLVEVAAALVRRGAGLEPQPASRPWRRCLQLVRMARREHGPLDCVPRFEEMRPLLARLEWFASTAREAVRRRLSRELSAAFEARHATMPLLRGPRPLIAGRVCVALAVAAAIQIAAASSGAE